eukprot:gnl/TRDRNA2_/TRDRNA2_155452_c0_seq1.p1 gnl/TRDRNA2_/TRDRNA2_155452_c0~~gnl/TRDRNA2_/TRDRNA2_155452_c0_seq1.p1  ORF type:complete len:423 (-),score=36.91 gnl/TRDRNA2_/TRDRNA2_155452_c0_seq1:42-1310(-)
MGTSPVPHLNFLGVLLCCTGYSISALGTLTQKLSFIRTQRAAEESENENGKVSVTFCMQPLWLAGFALAILGDVVAAAGFGLTPQSVAATLGVSSMVTSTLLAPCVLGEQVGIRHLAGVLCIALGCAVVVSVGPRAPAAHLQPFQLWEDVTDEAFLVWTAGALCVVFVSIATLRRHALMEETPHAMLYIALATSCSSYAMLNSKSLSSLLWAAGRGQGPPPHVWLLALLGGNVVALGFTGMYFMNLGLMNSGAAIFVPSYFAVSTFGQMLTGAIFFHELGQMRSFQRWAAFSAGFAVVLGSVYFLALIDYQEVEEAEHQVDLDMDAIEQPEPLRTRTRSMTLYGPVPSPVGRPSMRDLRSKSDFWSRSLSAEEPSLLQRRRCLTDPDSPMSRPWVSENSLDRLGSWQTESIHVPSLVGGVLR